jgi:MtfA peptidase
MRLSLVKSNSLHQQPIGWQPVIISIALVAILMKVRKWRTRSKAEKLEHDYEDNKARFSDFLSLHNPYFKSLGSINKERFLKRTILFMEAKEFKYIGLNEEWSMPLLISAAAIQLTFGLQHFLLDYFTTIYVLKSEYRYGDGTKPFEGHVSEEGIYFSWSNFIMEYADYTDGENVGLHEMAHALTYVNFQVQEGMDDSFRKKFYEFSPIGRPLFDRMQAGETNLLDHYAATNYEEFWAVCVETFFERPFPFREQLPELYFSLCHLLNQDPLTQQKILESPSGL